MTEEKLHHSKYKGFTAICEPLVSLKSRKSRVEFAKPFLKTHAFKMTAYGQMSKDKI